MFTELNCVKLLSIDTTFLGLCRQDTEYSGFGEVSTFAVLDYRMLPRTETTSKKGHSVFLSVLYNFGLILTCLRE